MVNLVAFARKHLSMAVRQIILPCARICFLSAPIYGISHNILTSSKKMVDIVNLILLAVFVAFALGMLGVNIIKLILSAVTAAFVLVVIAIVGIPVTPIIFAILGLV